MIKYPNTMRAMVLEKAGAPLVLKELPVPSPQPGQVLVRVIACGVCRTDLHIVDGELAHPKLPLIPGHEIIGKVQATGSQVRNISVGAFVGIPWLGYTCGRCRFCLSNRENLCDQAGFTGYTLDGGYAEYTVADERYCIPLTASVANPEGTPLLCAGLIGYRSYRMISNDAIRIGIYGFGAAAHILIQLAISQGKKIFAFTRDGDLEAQAYAMQLGAAWAGPSSVPAPEKLEGGIIFAPVGNLVPKALQDLDKGGVVVCGGIHMSDIPSFPYEILWGERSIRSVSNLTRKDAADFFQLIAAIPVHTRVNLFPLAKANEALEQLRRGSFQGAAVLVMLQGE